MTECYIFKRSICGDGSGIPPEYDVGGWWKSPWPPKCPYQLTQSTNDAIRHVFTWMNHGSLFKTDTPLREVPHSQGYPGTVPSSLGLSMNNFIWFFPGALVWGTGQQVERKARV